MFETHIAIGVLLAPIVAYNILRSRFVNSGMPLHNTMLVFQGTSSGVVYFKFAAENSGWRFIALVFFVLTVFEAFWCDMDAAKAPPAPEPEDDVE